MNALFTSSINVVVTVDAPIVEASHLTTVIIKNPNNHYPSTRFEDFKLLFQLFLTFTCLFTRSGEKISSSVFFKIPLHHFHHHKNWYPPSPTPSSSSPTTIITTRSSLTKVTINSRLEKLSGTAVQVVFEWVVSGGRDILVVLVNGKGLEKFSGDRDCNSIFLMTKPLHLKAPLFIGDKKINLSWKETVKSTPPMTSSTGIIVRSKLSKLCSRSNNEGAQKLLQEMNHYAIGSTSDRAKLLGKLPGVKVEDLAYLVFVAVWAIQGFQQKLVMMSKAFLATVESVDVGYGGSTGSVGYCGVDRFKWDFRICADFASAHLMFDKRPKPQEIVNLVCNVAHYQNSYTRSSVLVVENPARHIGKVKHPRVKNGPPVQSC
ncbi:hypothetical protein C5167_018150 [Papaver somniferum]|uniref:Uncharacterized protein n=1 Tax=Papaver somniferum TaxID=3469 RepID=A0A4Y7ILF1_PAPSO|nr:hypothetical protein C5167_018150 [Papaver somniferum]